MNIATIQKLVAKGRQAAAGGGRVMYSAHAWVGVAHEHRGRLPRYRRQCVPEAATVQPLRGGYGRDLDVRPRTPTRSQP